MCSIKVESHDEVFDCVEGWAASESQLSRRSTHLNARTRTGSWFWLNSREKNEEKEYVSKRDNSNVHYMRHLSFVPAEGWHLFWLGYQPVFFVREVKQGEWFFAESLYLKCFGWDTSILRTIMDKAQITYAEHDKNKTLSIVDN
jgi:hypothetical protein